MSRWSSNCAPSQKSPRSRRFPEFRLRYCVSRTVVPYWLSRMIINQLFAAFSGFGIPLILRKLNIDPALAGSVVLTTITDVVGFFAFLGLGALVLL